MATLDVVRNQLRTRAIFAVGRAAPELQRGLRSDSPRDTGLLEQRTSVDASGLVATARARTDYASYVREGTRPHVIRPRRGRVLSFYWPVTGRQMFLSRVNHPGTTGNTWWDRNLGRWPDLVREALRRAPSG